MTEAERLATLISRVEELHQPIEYQIVGYQEDEDGDFIAVPEDEQETSERCSCTPAMIVPYPCPTVMALQTRVIDGDAL